MRLQVLRDVLQPTFTLGRFSIDGAAKYSTVEPTVRGDGNPSTVSEWKIPGISAIPYGEYDIIMRYSPHFGCNVPTLVGVPGFEYVEIHWGNTAKDTDACIVIGMDRTANGVAHSRYACDDLYPQISAALAAGDPVKIVINGGNA